MTAVKLTGVKLVVCGLIVFCCSIAHAFEERTFDTPEGANLYDTLIKELRCLVCQNQNIADSNADLAVDLRREIYTMIQAGSTKANIIDFMVQRYGEFVLYNPRFSSRTIILWVAPLLLLLLGVFIMWRSTIGARKPAADTSKKVAHNSVDGAALERARRLLEDD